MKKTEKLGKYFTKGLQAGVLATALVTGMTGCPNPSSSNGGYEIDDDKTQPGPDCGRDYIIPEPAELDGVKFVNDGEVWGDLEKGDEYNNHYQKAQEFMNKKVAELSQAVEGQDHIPLYQEIDNALQKMNQGNNIRDNINGNYTALATVFADFEKNQLDSYSDKDYYTYQASYIKLAHNAYNQSLGHLKNDYSLDGNLEMMNDTTNFFGKKLAEASLSYDQLNVDKAKEYMTNTMNYIANNNGASSDVLKKFVELALYNESLYGLNDLAKNAKLGLDVVVYNTPRKAATFENKISSAKMQMQTYNIQDAGMTM